MTAKTQGAAKPASEGSNVLPALLFIAGTTVAIAVFLESYLQLSGSSVSLLTIAHDYGLLENYKLSKEPNRGIWHPIGWIGSGCFITMMLYSFRKHIKFMQDAGPLRYWLDVHMFLGITGTLLITVHSRQRADVLSAKYEVRIFKNLFYFKVGIPYAVVGRFAAEVDGARLTHSPVEVEKNVFSGKFRQVQFKAGGSYVVVVRGYAVVLVHVKMKALLQSEWVIFSHSISV